MSWHGIRPSQPLAGRLHTGPRSWLSLVTMHPEGVLVWSARGVPNPSGRGGSGWPDSSWGNQEGLSDSDSWAAETMRDEPQRVCSPPRQMWGHWVARGRDQHRSTLKKSSADLQFSYVPGFYTIYKQDLVEQTRFNDSYKIPAQNLAMCEHSLIEPTPLKNRRYFF